MQTLCMKNRLNCVLQDTENLLCCSRVALQSHLNMTNLQRGYVNPFLCYEKFKKPYFWLFMLIFFVLAELFLASPFEVFFLKSKIVYLCCGAGDHPMPSAVGQCWHEQEPDGYALTLLSACKECYRTLMYAEYQGEYVDESANWKQWINTSAHSSTHTLLYPQSCVSHSSLG